MAKKYKPKEPINKKRYLQLGLSIDPKDIPAEKKSKSIIAEKIEALAKIKYDAIKAIEDAA